MRQWSKSFVTHERILYTRLEKMMFFHTRGLKRLKTAGGAGPAYKPLTDAKPRSCLFHLSAKNPKVINEIIKCFQTLSERRAADRESCFQGLEASRRSKFWSFRKAEVFHHMAPKSPTHSWFHQCGADDVLQQLHSLNPNQPKIHSKSTWSMLVRLANRNFRPNGAISSRMDEKVNINELWHNEQ